MKCHDLAKQCQMVPELVSGCALELRTRRWTELRGAVARGRCIITRSTQGLSVRRQLRQQQLRQRLRRHNHLYRAGRVQVREYTDGKKTDSILLYYLFLNSIKSILVKGFFFPKNILRYLLKGVLGAFSWRKTVVWRKDVWTESCFHLLEIEI